MIDIHRESDAQTAARHAAEAVEHAMAGSIPVLLLLSGGSPLEILKYLHVIPDHVTVTVSDDRFSDDPKINNFAQIRHLSASHWIDSRQGNSVVESGVLFDTALKSWRSNNPNGKIVMTQGIGLDGHTVGMIGRVFDDPNIWAVGYEAINKYPLRITTTAPFLRMVDVSVLFVCGDEKQKPLRDALAKEGSVHKTPARIIHEMKRVLLYTNLSFT